MTSDPGIFMVLWSKRLVEHKKMQSSSSEYILHEDANFWGPFNNHQEHGIPCSLFKEFSNQQLNLVRISIISQCTKRCICPGRCIILIRVVNHTDQYHIFFGFVLAVSASMYFCVLVHRKRKKN